MEVLLVYLKSFVNRRYLENLINGLNFLGIRAEKLPLPGPSLRLRADLKLMEGFENLFRRKAESADIIHFVSDWVTGYLAKYTKKPCVMTAHGTYSTVDAFKRRFSLFRKNPLEGILQSINGVISVSNYTQSKLPRQEGQIRRVIYPGVDTELFVPGENRSKSNVFSVLSVGDNKPRKGYSISVPAFRAFSEGKSDVEYLVIGKNTQALGGDKIFGLGEVDEKTLVSAYQNCAVFMLTPIKFKTTFEGFCQVFLEAQACGKFVIATNSGGVPEAVCKESGVIISEGNVNEAQRALEECYRNRPEKKVEARRFAESLDYKKQAKKVLEFYEEVLNQ